MKILIAEDSRVTRLLLKDTLVKWGYDPIACSDGDEAWRILENEKDPPQLAILDWMMPKLDGLELCRKIRRTPDLQIIYIIMLTSRYLKEDIVKGFESGADDYLVKPFDKDELYARLKVGARVVELQSSLAGQVKELEESLSRVKLLQGLLPICTYCKKIRNDKNYWEQVEGYLSKHSEAQFSHGICPECYEEHLSKEIDGARKGDPDNESEIEE
jgi:DNA-binding response OmpR family regulator